MKKWNKVVVVRCYTFREKKKVNEFFLSTLKVYWQTIITVFEFNKVTVARCYACREKS